MEHVPDRQVDEALDAQLRRLLTTCFPGPMFLAKRYNAELPAHRWIVRDGPDRLVAHAALHDKQVGTGVGDIRIGGVAEVCVHPDHRGRGTVRSLLDAVHAWILEARIPAALLFGKPEVYGSSGYRTVPNPFRFQDPAAGGWVCRPVSYAMVRCFGSATWPEGVIDLRCPLF